MSFVQMYFFCFILIWEDVYNTGSWAMEVEAEEGAELEIKCSHSNAQGNVKYFCKDPCDDKDVLITSKQKDNKYSIKDNGNTFSVTISGMTMDDSGTYWCGVERVGKDTYNYVFITVTPKTDSSQSNTSLQNKAANKKLLYIGVGLGALLLILLTAVATFIIHRHRDTSKPMGDDVTDTDPSKYAQKPSQDTTSCSSTHQSSVPSTAEDNRAITHKPTCDIYANVQTESVCYSSLIFSETKADTAPTVTPECAVYSEVKTETKCI